MHAKISTHSFKLCLAMLALLFVAGCATTNEPETPSAAINVADAKWLRSRETFYRSLGWSTLDARDQAEHDLSAGKTNPVEQPHMSRGRSTLPN